MLNNNLPGNNTTSLQNPKGNNSMNTQSNHDTYSITSSQETSLWVGENILNQLLEIVSPHKYTSYFLICDTNTKKLFAEKIAKQLPANIPLHIHTVPSGEEAKQTLELMRILEHMLEVELDKKSVVLAVGGGVVSDIATVASGLFYRGIDCINVPTTLLAQVDAAIGGKGAVNMRKYKNMIGVIKQPTHIIVDTALLESLPEDQYKSGMGEIVKYAIALDKNLFTLLEETDKLDKKTLTTIITRCIKLKMQVVEKDPQDVTGIRATLNFGHTIGHAVELATTLSHGEAVSVGMMAALSISRQLGLLSKEKVQKAVALIQKYHLPTTVQQVSEEDIIAALKKDKKTILGIPKFVLLEDIGIAKAYYEVPKEILENAIKEILV